MANKKKKKKPSQITEASVQKKKFPVKRALTLLLSTLAAFALYEAVLVIEERAGLSFSIITPVYYIAVTLLFCAIFFLNRGFSKAPVTAEALIEDGVAPEDADALCEKLNRQKNVAKALMMILVPLIFAVLLDVIYLFYGDIFAGAFKFITGGGK